MGENSEMNNQEHTSSWITLEVVLPFKTPSEKHHQKESGLFPKLQFL